MSKQFKVFFWENKFINPLKRGIKRFVNEEKAT